MKYQIGVKIKSLRELKGLRQKEFAKAIGVSGSRVSNWEQGINRPDADYISTICNVLQVSADELLGLDLPDAEITESERQLVYRYRQKPELQAAVRVLLGLEQ